ncbi:MAG: glutamine amidotransferase [Planctomycetota bacterium]|nr:glutamine amidotransferase [Planctomycetota bacterium]
MPIRSSIVLHAVVFLITAVVGAGVRAAEPTAKAPALPDKETPLDWVYPPPQPLRVHVVRGLWSREYRLEEAMALAGAGVITESWHTQGMGFGYVGGWDANSGGGVPEFPEAAEDLLANHVLILCNVNAKAFTARQQQLLKEFVENGGAVLFLGGRFAFGSQWSRTPLADIAPVTFVEQGFDLKHAEQGLPMSPGPDRLAENRSPLAWDKAPRVFWHHDVEPKPGSKVTVLADGHPLLIAGTFGKGRVALFAGSVMGDPPSGALALWQWDDWPRVLSETLTWLAKPRDQLNGLLSPALRQRLTTTLATLDPLAEGDEAQASLAAIEPLLLRAGKLCRDQATIESILKAIAAGDADLSPALAEFLGRRAEAFPPEQAANLASKLLASGKPAKTALGLRLLAAGRGAGAVDTLLGFLASGEVARAAKAPAADADASLAGGTSAAPPASRDAEAAMIRLAAMKGLAWLGDAKAAPALHKMIQTTEPNGRFEPVSANQGVEAYTITTATRLYQTNLLAALACGDATAAAPLADALLGNVYVASRARSGYNGPKEAKGSVEAALPYILAWEVELNSMVRACPVERLAPLAPALAGASDIRIAPSACAAFGGRILNPQLKATLQASKVKAVSALAAPDSPSE